LESLTAYSSPSGIGVPETATPPPTATQIAALVMNSDEQALSVASGIATIRERRAGRGRFREVWNGSAGAKVPRVLFKCHRNGHSPDLLAGVLPLIDGAFAKGPRAGQARRPLHGPLEGIPLG